MQNYVGQQNIQPTSQYQTAPIHQNGCQCQHCQSIHALSQQPVQQQAVQQYQQSAPQPAQYAQPVQYSQPQQQAQNVSVPNYSGVNIQIFNPSVTPPGATAPVYNVNAPNYSANPASGCYPSGYYTNNYGQNGLIGQNAQSNQNLTSTENTSSDKKTEKREIVQLTDEYIMNLENYLNSQDKEIRLMGAKEVIARLDEDHSRKDDKALNALVNKMLQDPYTPVRVMAMSALNSRIASGDAFTVNLLQQMQNSASGYGQDALQASEILLKMSGQTTEKEFEVKNTSKTETKKETKTSQAG